MNELSTTQHNMAGIMQTGLTIAGGKNENACTVAVGRSTWVSSTAGCWTIGC